MIAIILFTIQTTLIFLFGPTPYQPSESDFLTDPTTGLNETRDRIILLSWWITTSLLVFMSVFQQNKKIISEKRTSQSWLMIIMIFLLGVSIIILFYSVSWTNDITGMWPGMFLSDFVLGFVITAAILIIWRSKKLIALTASALLGSFSLAVIIPPLVQTPGAIRDHYHFQFTVEEIMAASAGNFPLSDFIPQYTNLLSFPVAPLLHLLDNNPVLGVLIYLSLLQIFAFAISIAFPIINGGWRMAAPALTISLAPALAELNLGAGVNAVSYFAVTPLRIILPIIVILVAFLLLRKKEHMRFIGFLQFAALGLLIGVALLNNPDYGAPVALSVFITTIFSIVKLKKLLIVLILYISGVILVFVTYFSMGLILNKPIDWNNWLLFQRTFGIEGFMSVPIASFGPHIAAVSLFAATTIIGTSLLWRHRKFQNTLSKNQGLALTLVGSWSLLALPYFAGRSLSPTLISGYAFMIGLNVSVLLPTIRVSFRALTLSDKRNRYNSVSALTLSLIVLVFTSSFYSFVYSPGHYLNNIFKKNSFVYNPPIEIVDTTFMDKKSFDDPILKNLVTQGRLAQGLPLAALISFTNDVPTLLIVSSPGYLSLSPIYSKLQCSRSWPYGVDHFLVNRETAISLQSNIYCSNFFLFENSINFSKEGNEYALLRRNPLAAR